MTMTLEEIRSRSNKPDIVSHIPNPLGVIFSRLLSFMIIFFRGEKLVLDMFLLLLQLYTYRALVMEPSLL